MRYLCTGGAGFIGSALVRRLMADGHGVTVLDDFSRGRAERCASPGLAARPLIWNGDIRDPGVVADAAAGCDAVVHLAYLQGTQNFYSNPRQVLDVALRGMLNVLDACEKQGIRDLTLISSSEAYQVPPVTPTDESVPLSVPDPLNPRYSYGGGKIASELMAVAWAADGVLDRFVIARPHNIIGPDMGREHVVPQFAIRLKGMLTGPHPAEVSFPIQGTGKETRTFCDISDCVNGLTLLLDPKVPSGIYHVGTTDERTVAEVADVVADAFGVTLFIQPGKLAAGSPPRRLPDISKLAALGYQPKVSFREAVTKTTEWYRDNDA